MEVFQPAVRRSLLAEAIFDAPRLARTETSGVYHRIWFEKRPEQIIRDFLVLKKGDKAIVGRGVGFLNEADQQVEMFQARRIALVTFQFGEAIVQQVLFDLG